VSVWRHLRAIALLPATMTVAIPALLVWAYGADGGWWSVPGALLITVGLALFAWTVVLFETRGRGTLAPWDATTRLVVQGPYRYVRNPMITGVLTILAGEATAVASPAIAIEAATFFAINAIYFPLSEEPGLRRRFGEDYERYRANVPRWVPRLRPWESASSIASSTESDEPSDQAS
jgi:protein-S-isoprenylcysteine O-methyltransferase Ste14